MSTKRLNKSECNEIAHKMTQSILDEYNRVENSLSNILREKLEKQIPLNQIKRLFSDPLMKKYIKTTSSGYLILGNRRSIYLSFDPVPCIENCPSVDINNQEELIEANKLYDLRDSLKTKRKLLMEELEEILFKLSTYKRISEHLPEALSFLPEAKQNELPQLNLNEFRNKLNKELNL